MMAPHATVILGCGCTTTVAIPDSLTRAAMRITEPSGQSARTHDLEIVRLSSSPHVFIEGKGPRPDWARSYHTLVAFDINAFAEANWKPFERLFAPYRTSSGAYVPQCWLHDLLAGSGRFYGLWAHQRPMNGRAIQHLMLIESDVDGSEAESEAAEVFHEDIVSDLELD